MDDKEEYLFACSIRDMLEVELLPEMDMYEALCCRADPDQVLECCEQFISYGDRIGEKLDRATTLGLKMQMQMPNCCCLFRALAGRGDPMQYMAMATAEVNQLLVVIDEAILNWEPKQEASALQAGETDQQVYERVLQTFHSLVGTLSHSKLGKRMEADLSAADWQRYYAVASTKAVVAKDPAAHFESKSKSEARKRQN